MQGWWGQHRETALRLPASGKNREVRGQFQGRPRGPLEKRAAGRSWLPSYNIHLPGHHEGHLCPLPDSVHRVGTSCSCHQSMSSVSASLKSSSGVTLSDLGRTQRLFGTGRYHRLKSTRRSHPAPECSHFSLGRCEPPQGSSPRLVPLPANTVAPWHPDHPGRGQAHSISALETSSNPRDEMPRPERRLPWIPPPPPAGCR